jgi:hypothetical protein
VILKHPARTFFIEVGLFVAGGYYLYNHVLSDEAKDQLNHMFDTLKTSFTKISEVAHEQDSANQEQEKKAAEANRENVERQWESLGY